MSRIGLVIEGGGLRGIYTAGVLDSLMENDIYIPYVIGVSMGACNGASYISRQIGRTKRATLDYLHDKRYISYRRLFKKETLFGMDFIFNEIPNELVPFDYKTYVESSQKFVVVTTDCNSGDAVYYDNKDMDKENKLLRASSSLPLISNVVKYKGKELLDGGISDSIPVKKALSDGNEKLVIILTQPSGYRKKLTKGMFMARKLYSDYPNLIKAIENRHRGYNETLEYIEQLELAGKAFVIRPKEALKVKRAERNIEKLEKCYEIGYEQMGRSIKELNDFLKE